MDQPDKSLEIAGAMADNIAKAAAIMIRTISVARAMTETPAQAYAVTMTITDILDKAIAEGVAKDEAEVRAKLAIRQAQRAAQE